jgi:hypothetical protein
MFVIGERLYAHPVYNIVLSLFVIGRNIVSQILYKYISMHFMSDLMMNLEECT